MTGPEAPAGEPEALASRPAALAGEEDPGCLPAWRRTARDFCAAVKSGRLDLPAPGGGRTRQRWAALAELAGEDLSLARLGEGHADAVAILAELGGRGTAGQPVGRVGGAAARARPGRQAGRRRLAPARHQAVLLGRANVHARPGHSRRRRRGPTVRRHRRVLDPWPGTWPATGMAGSDTLDISFDDVAAEPVGPAGGYTARPGFAHGGAGVAACWYGGARAVGGTLLASAHERDLGPHALAHLGAGISRCGSHGRLGPGG